MWADTVSAPRVDSANGKADVSSLRTPMNEAGLLGLDRYEPVSLRLICTALSFARRTCMQLSLVEALVSRFLYLYSPNAYSYSLTVLQQFETLQTFGRI